MNGTRFVNWTPAVGDLAFVVDGGGVFMGRIDTLQADTKGLNAFVYVESLHRSVKVPLGELHTQPDRACLAAFTGKLPEARR